MELHVSSDDFPFGLLQFAFLWKRQGVGFCFPRLSLLGAGVWRKSNWRVRRTFTFSLSLF